MAMKWICGCLLAVALFGCQVDGQIYGLSQKPQPPPDPQTPQKPQPPQRPQPPPRPQTPQKPQPPQRPQPPPRPQTPQKPQPPPRPQTPQKPQPPPRPQIPQRPQPPQKPQMPQITQRPQPNQKPQTPKVVPEVYHSCEVADQYRIQCGAPGISGSDCEAINCCFDGRQCYYGKSVTLQCTKDGQFIVVIARDATLPNLDLETISFYGGDQSCAPVGVTSAFAIYQYGVTECGTIVTEEPGVITYENRMSSSYEVAIGRDGVITRDTSFELLLQCRYIGTTIEALVIEVGEVPPPPPVAAPGPLRVEFKIANGVCTNKGCDEVQAAYTSFYMDSDYPVTKVLRDPVYIEINILERTDPNLVLTLGRCWATSDPYPYSLPQWDLLIDGCPYRDDRYQTELIHVDESSGLLYPSHYRRFVFKMFTFVSTSSPSNPGKGGKGKVADPEVLTPLNEKVYIHCDTAVCQPSVQNNCQPRCFRKRRSIASFKQRSETPVVSSPEIVFIDPAQ